MVQIRFNHHYSLYNPGEVAGFSEAEAAEIVDREIGEVVGGEPVAGEIAMTIEEGGAPLDLGEQIGGLEYPKGAVELPSGEETNPELDAQLEAANAPTGTVVNGAVIEKPKGRTR